MKPRFEVHRRLLLILCSSFLFSTSADKMIQIFFASVSGFGSKYPRKNVANYLLEIVNIIN